MNANVYINPAENLIDGTQGTTTTGAPLNGGTSQRVREVIVSNKDAAIVLYVGNSASQNTPLAAGASIRLAVDDLKKVWVRSASGTPSVAWLGLV